MTLSKYNQHVEPQLQSFLIEDLLIKEAKPLLPLLEAVIVSRHTLLYLFIILRWSSPISLNFLKVRASLLTKPSTALD